MKSKAHIKSHPLHPILVAFPIAFFIGTLLFDVLALAYDNRSFFTTAQYLQTAGIVSALMAAVPGFIDFVYTVPPQSSAKKRAMQHGMLNITVVVIFTIALFLRKEASPYILIGIELAGVILLNISGWMGGTLVHRNQIGVDIRYANAGKWKELHVGEATGQVEVAEIDELAVNQMKLIHLKDKRVVLARSENGYVAFDDRCTHRGGSLAAGSMMCGTVQCPWHGSQFNVQTGNVTAGPAKEPIKTYKTSEAGGKIFLNL